uniref:GH16 domain-containing protein n=1 Tax=Tetranychus urticae TaxID=32264 RepID=T1KLV6_TETUR
MDQIGINKSTKIRHSRVKIVSIGHIYCCNFSTQTLIRFGIISVILARIFDTNSNILSHNLTILIPHRPFVMSKCVFYLLLVFTLESDANKWTHDKQTISWSGYTWRIKDRFWGPGPNQFTADSVRVINNKILSLTTKPLSGGKWSSAEIYTVLSPGHGTYRWIIESEIANLPPQVVLGLFTWDDNAPKEFYREIDIEIAKFGQSSWSTNSQFTILPFRDHSKITRFAVEPSSGRTQAEFTWSPCGVTFRLTKEGDKRQYFNHTDTSLRLAHGNENVRINLWLFNGQPPTPREPVTINISSFTWLPLEQTNSMHVVPCNEKCNRAK